MTYDEIIQMEKIDDKSLKRALENALKQTRSCLPEFAEHFKSIYSENNFYKQVDNVFWTNGFWTGELWLAYQKTNDDLFKRAALKQIPSFKKRIEEGIETDTHDLGFLYSLSCVAGYKVLQKEEFKEIGLEAAEKLVSRFHEKGEFIQAWGSLEDTNNYRLIVDSLLNVPLLFWASEASGKSYYAEKAAAHVRTTLNVVVRDDYSTYHTYYFDPKNGRPLRGETHQGYSADSAWARGQAWAIYGSALAMKYVPDKKYIDLFEHLLMYFIGHLDEDLIPYWDLIFTKESKEPWDSSASAIVICGLLEMSRHVTEDKSLIYKKIAQVLMKSLVEKCAANSPDISNGQLLHGVYGKKTPYNDCIDHGIDECNLWGDYFYMEALTRMTGEWETFW